MEKNTTRACPVWEIALRSKLQRPYVNVELEDIRQRTTRFRRLSDVMIHHNDCLHRYRVKRFGHKERIILECGQESSDIGRCSICWRIEREMDPPLDLIEEYQSLLEGHVTPEMLEEITLAKKRLLAKNASSPSSSSSEGEEEVEEEPVSVDALDYVLYHSQRSPAWDSVAPRAVLVEKAFYEWLYQ